MEIVVSNVSNEEMRILIHVNRTLNCYSHMGKTKFYYQSILITSASSAEHSGN